MGTLDGIPLELLKLIATFLPPASLALLSLVSRRCHAAVNSDHIVWRAAFLATFEPPRKPRAYEWRREFQTRIRVLRELPEQRFKGLSYSGVAGVTAKEREALRVVLDLLYDAQPDAKLGLPGRLGLNAPWALTSAMTPYHARSPIPWSVNTVWLSRTLPMSILAPFGILILPTLATAAAISQPPTPSTSLESIQLELTIARLLLHPIRPAPQSDSLYRLHALGFAYGNNGNWKEGKSIIPYAAENIALLFAHHIPPVHGSHALFHQAYLLAPEERPRFWYGRLPSPNTDTDTNPEQEQERWEHRYFGAHAYKPADATDESSDGTLAELWLSTDGAGGLEGHGRDRAPFVLRHGRLEGFGGEAGWPQGWRRVGFMKEYTHTAAVAGPSRMRCEGVMWPGRNILVGRYCDAGAVGDGDGEGVVGGAHGIWMLWQVPPTGPDLASRDNRLVLR